MEVMESKGAVEERADEVQPVDYRTDPSRYRHWQLKFDGAVATLVMDTQEDGGIRPGYKLKLNSYDLGVDIELHDALQRVRFEHPEVRSVVLTSAKSRVFCSGANIYMLGTSSHAWKVNFCKFTNETRNGIEDTSRNSGIKFLAACNGTTAGGGYELALACDEIVLIDDRSSAVSLPEVPLLGVLPGTGGLTRVTDKRKVRRDLADIFCTTPDGVQGPRAKDWKLVDEVVKPAAWAEQIQKRAKELAEQSDRPADAKGVALTPLQRVVDERGYHYQYVDVEFDREGRTATFVVKALSTQHSAVSLEQIVAMGAEWWPLKMARELDDAILSVRTNELELGLWILKTEGDAEAVLEIDRQLMAHKDHWFVREVINMMRRTLARLDVCARSMYAVVEEGSCFAGTLMELALAADRTYMLKVEASSADTSQSHPSPSLRSGSGWGTHSEVEGEGAQTGVSVPPFVMLSEMNFGPLAMVNGLARVVARFYSDADAMEKARGLIGRKLNAEEAMETGLVTAAPDELDWADELRQAIESRAALSPDALTGLEANLRFGLPETLETRVFGRLSAWQNWIFVRPNAVGASGALKVYGSGKRAKFGWNRV